VRVRAFDVRASVPAMDVDQQPSRGRMLASALSSPIEVRLSPEIRSSAARRCSNRARSSGGSRPPASFDDAPAALNHQLPKRVVAGGDGDIMQQS
jgi:hypothetical protein